MRNLLAGIGVWMVLKACGGNSAGQSPAQQPTSVGGANGPAAVPKLPVVLGEPAVVSSPYGLPDATGHETAVVFEVTNPNNVWLLMVPYRVETDGPDGAMDVSAGTDTFNIRPHETRLVVATSDVKGPTPTGAKVTVYAAPQWQLGGTYQVPTVEQDKMVYTHTGVNCDKGTVGCSVTADMTWKGDKPVLPQRVAVIIRKGTDGKGPIVGAGKTGFTQFSMANMMQPNSPAPIEINAVGNDDQKVVKAGITTEFVVD